MKSFLILVAFLGSQLIFASEHPAQYPLVKGLVRKIDKAANRISLKHDDIPNLSMPGMTMSFAVQDPAMLEGLSVGDHVHFVADEIEGELTILWLEKIPAPSVETSNILCTGLAHTSPETNVEIEIRHNKFSTIRYEFAEGPYQGTAYINSIGHMTWHQDGSSYIARSGTGKLDSKLIFKIQDNKITEAYFTKFGANMLNTPVQCSFD